MSLRRVKRRLTAATTIVMVTAAIAGGMTLGGRTPIDGFLLDAAVAARAMVEPPRDDPADSPVAVIGLDARTLDSDELVDVPRVFLAPYWAKLLDAVFTAGARSVGFDAVFAYSSNRFRPDYDRPFLEALGKYRDRVVLARTLRLPPADPFQFAVGALDDPGALGLIELQPDSDGVFRWVPASIGERAEDGSVTEQPTLVAGVLKRAGAPPMPEKVLVAPPRHLETLPTYSMIDVLRCADRDPNAVAKRFRGRIVLIGTLLPEEDRKFSTGRFLKPPPAVPEPPTDGCSLAPLGASIENGRSVPGVHIHAGAVAAVASGDLTLKAPREVTAAVAAATAVLGCYLGFAATPVVAFGAMVVALAVLLAAGVGLLAGGLWLPLAVPVAALLVSISLTYAVRFTLESRQRRRITAAFGHYLAPTIVQSLVEGAEPTLGGETREITVMFADLSGFTAMSGRVPPEELVALTNRYLRLIVEEVERTGGYVDKFIGDAVMAFWNAPLDDPDHAANAVDAALGAVRRIEAQSAGTPAGEPRFSVKIGIETGPAVVGNVGTEGRCNYTAVGETVNVAARLESVPPDYRCYVTIGESAAARIGDAFLMRELDAIVLRGRSEPLKIHEPIARRQRIDERQSEAVERFANALRLYRDRRFAEAQALWAQLVEGYAAAGLLPGPAAVMAARAAKLAEEPPGPDWVGVWVRQSK